MEKEVLRLFKSYLSEDKKENIEFSEEAMKFGILINKDVNESIIKEAISQYGKDGEKWNQTFHKDFEIVKNAPIEDLIAQQMIHYITTYGFESLGFFDNDLVYIPNEKLEIPELDINSGVEFIIIKPITTNELTDKLMILLTSGIALSEQTIQDIMVLSDYIDKDRFDEISNREVKITLYDKYNIMPGNPDEFFRYLIFKTTGETLKINNKKMIEEIKHSNKEVALKMFESYLSKKNGYEKLSSIFLRNKNLFLAFKVDKNENKELATNINKIINKLRKLAVNNHKPLSKNILDSLTDGNIDIDLDKLFEALDNITLFREIRIVNGILYRLKGNNNIVYRIRNGKSYVKTLENNDAIYEERLTTIYNEVYKHLVNRLSNKVKNKTIYIPKNITYAAPTSEKQFNGNIPDGSYLEIPREDNFIYGIHWTNLKKSNVEDSTGFYGEQTKAGEERVDLDLKQMNKSAVFGWDASYRSESGNILFSGDMTNAPLPNGATELFYVNQNYGHGAFLITLNMFTSNSKDVPFEFVIAKATHSSNTRVNYVLDPNNILEKIDMVVKKSERQKVVGFITIGDTIRFYFNDFSAGASVATSRKDNITMGAFDYLQSYSKIQLKLNDILKEAGAILTEKETITKTIIKEKVDEEGNVIETTTEEKEIPVEFNLSPKTITKETLINLFN